MGGSGTLYKAWIDIGLKGLDKVDKYMKDAISSVQKSLNSLNSEFRFGTSMISDFTRAGSPAAFNTLGASIELLKARIGTAFTPIILSASKSIQDLSGWIKGLDYETKKQIATWTTLGVVGAGVVAVFGNLVLSVGRLGASFLAFSYNNPLLTGLLAVAGAAAKAYYEVDRISKLNTSGKAEVNRIQSGKMTADDVGESWYAKELEKVQDPAKRKALAVKFQKNLYDMQMAMVQQYEDVSRTPLDAATSLGTGAAGNATQKINDIQKQMAIVMQYVGAEGKSVKVLPSTKKRTSDDGLMLGAMGGSGMRAGSMNLDSAYGNLNNLALGQNQLQQKILQEQMLSNKIALESKGKVESIQEMLLRATGN